MTAAAPLHFRKMNGLGNDFVVFDARTRAIAMDEAKARAIADRRTGVGCDQLLILERPAGARGLADVFMRIRNNDGGEVSACGNGARCVADYVMRGGAVLEAAGPEDATPLSLYNTPIAQVLPAMPTGRITTGGFKPQISDIGTRHPVTADLMPPGASEGDWGRWFRLINAAPQRGTTVMEGADAQPLLVLDRIGEGRVAQLLSDQAWLWTRGIEGGGRFCDSD